MRHREGGDMLEIILRTAISQVLGPCELKDFKLGFLANNEMMFLTIFDLKSQVIYYMELHVVSFLTCTLTLNI